MSLRFAFLILLGAFAVSSGVAGIWQLVDSRTKAAAAEWIVLSGRLGDVAQRISAQLAMERGLTVIVPAGTTDDNAALKAELRQRRAAADVLYAQLTPLADELMRRSPEHPIALAVSRVENDRRDI